MSGGAERQAVLAASQLAQLGHEVEVLAYHAENQLTELVDRHGVVVRIFNRGSRLGRVRALAAHMRMQNYDVVHAFKATSSVWGRIAARLAGSPRVFAGFRSNHSEPALSRWCNRLLGGRKGDWIVLSEAARRVVLADYGVAPERVHVVYNGVDVECLQSQLSVSEARESFGLPAQQPVISIVARLRAEKNHALFLQTASMLKAAGRRVSYVIAGDGPARDEVITTARQAGLGSDLHCIGHCDRVADLLRASDVLVITSKHEGLCSALVEAGAAGRPAVSTDNGGASEVIVDGESGYIVRNEDPEALARRVGELLDSPALREKMGAMGRQFVAERFSMDTMGRRLVDVYQGAA